METFWFFWLRFRRAYDSAYDSDFWFSLSHKRSYDSAYDSDSDFVASENQPLAFKQFFLRASWRVLWYMCKVDWNEYQNGPAAVLL